MIKTQDGHTLLRGRIVWVIGRDIDTEKYRPRRGVVHRTVGKGDECWLDYAKCKEAADILNDIELNLKD